MAGAGVVFRGYMPGNSSTGIAPPGALPTALFGNPQTFTAAANTQASDYDRIMQGYADLGNFYKNNPITATPVSYTPISPTTTPYSESPDVTQSLSTLQGLSATGGYSAADIADIRARDISPIRSIYANAQENVDRQRALQGGYDPSYNATQASMARDEASQISDVTTAANADIAQSVVQNKLAAATPYASAASAESSRKTAVDQANAAAINEINAANAARSTSTGEFNAQLGLEAGLANRQGLTGALAGSTSLYGTTPALTTTFGNQVMQATNANQQQQLLNQRQNLLPFQLAS